MIWKFDLFYTLWTCHQLYHAGNIIYVMNRISATPPINLKNVKSKIQKKRFFGFTDIAILKRNQCHNHANFSLERQKHLFSPNVKKKCYLSLCLGKKCTRYHGQMNAKLVLNQLFKRGKSCLLSRTCAKIISS